MVWYGMVWYGMVWYGMVWYGMVWYGMVWYGMVRFLILVRHNRSYHSSNKTFKKEKLPFQMICIEILW